MTCLYLHHGWSNATEKIQNASVKETGPSYHQKVASSDNPGQNIWHKLKKYDRIGQDFKNVISNFTCFLTAIVNV